MKRNVISCIRVCGPELITSLGLHVKLHIVMNVLIVKEISCKYSVAVELMRSYVICIIKHIIWYQRFIAGLAGFPIVKCKPVIRKVFHAIRSRPYRSVQAQLSGGISPCSHLHDSSCHGAVGTGPVGKGNLVPVRYAVRICRLSAVLRIRLSFFINAIVDIHHVVQCNQ